MLLPLMGSHGLCRVTSAWGVDMVVQAGNIHHWVLVSSAGLPVS